MKYSRNTPSRQRNWQNPLHFLPGKYSFWNFYDFIREFLFRQGYWLYKKLSFGYLLFRIIYVENNLEIKMLSINVRKSVQVPQFEVTQNIEWFLLYDERTLFLRFHSSFTLIRWLFDIFLIITNLTLCILNHLSVVKKKNELNTIHWVFIIAPDKFIERLYIWIKINVNSNEAGTCVGCSFQT